MKFSILTPHFDQLRFLGGCVASVAEEAARAKQMGIDVEHIVMDGGTAGAGGAARLLKNLSRRHPHLTWRSEGDAGQADALNKAFALADGDVIGWLNADETYAPGAMETAAQALRENPRAACVYGDFRRVTPAGEVMKINRQWDFDEEVCRAQTQIIMNCAAFFRRDALAACTVATADELIDGPWDPSFACTMDWDLYIRLFRGGRRPVRVRRVLGDFVMHPASKTATAQDQFEKEIERLRRREFPDMDDAEFARHKARQKRRMIWHMLRDGVLWGKVWFALVGRRKWSRYFGDATDG